MRLMKFTFNISSSSLCVGNEVRAFSELENCGHDFISSRLFGSGCQVGAHARRAIGPNLRCIYFSIYDTQQCENISKIIIIKSSTPYDQVVRPGQIIRVITHNKLQHAGSSRGNE